MSSAPIASEARTYIDASAFVKLLIDEAESEPLARFLQLEPRRLVASAVLEVEVTRVVRAVGVDVSAAVAELEMIDVVEITRAIRRIAGSLDPPALRTLDAIHLATAIESGVGDILVYDRRLAEAAAAHGLTALSPGA